MGTSVWRHVPLDLFLAVGFCRESHVKERVSREPVFMASQMSPEDK